MTSVATLSEVLNYTRCNHHCIKICLTEKEETCLVLIWLPQNYFRFACIMYATCTFTTLKFQLFSAPGWEEIKHISDCTCTTVCSSASALLMLHCVPVTIYLALRLIFMERKSQYTSIPPQVEQTWSQNTHACPKIRSVPQYCHLYTSTS